MAGFRSRHFIYLGGNESRRGLLPGREDGDGWHQSR